MFHGLAGFAGVATAAIGLTFASDILLFDIACGGFQILLMLATLWVCDFRNDFEMRTLLLCSFCGEEGRGARGEVTLCHEKSRRKKGRKILAASEDEARRLTSH